MNDETIEEPKSVGPDGLSSVDVPRESSRTILFQFVLIPLGVVLIGVLIFVVFGMIALEKHDPREYLRDIRSGSAHRRWQAAYELSKSIKRGDAENNPAFAAEIRELYGRSEGDDPRIRRYLAMVLGRIGDREAAPLLVESLRQGEIEDRIFAALALAELNDPRAVKPLEEMARSTESDLRKTAIYALGRLQGDPAVLVGALDDPVTDVRWNAAIALARRHDTRGAAVLREMLDRKQLDAMAGVREDQKEEAMLAAIAASVEMTDGEMRQDLERIAREDPNLRVRSAAIEAVEKLQR